MLKDPASIEAPQASFHHKDCTDITTEIPMEKHRSKSCSTTYLKLAYDKNNIKS